MLKYVEGTTMDVEKMFLLVKKIVSAEDLRKYPHFLMHEDNLPQYSWLNKAIPEHSIPTKLNENDVKQFNEMGGGADHLNLLVIDDSKNVKANYLLVLAKS